ncbi:MAG TPA: aldehyde dehydrogenase family protein [Streptosporangiaceae bacterium]|nr:aldehyde dehydrogenase family protein [Streptosporangiaceae bacterium]
MGAVEQAWRESGFTNGHGGIRLARRLRAGMVHVNDATPQDEALAPVGGIGQPGLGGRFGGEASIEEFAKRRWLTATQRTLTNQIDIDPNEHRPH